MQVPPSTCPTPRRQLERAAFLASARGGRPRASDEVGRSVELGYRAQVYRLAVARVGARPLPGGAGRGARRRRRRPAEPAGEPAHPAGRAAVPRRLGRRPRRLPGRGRRRQPPGRPGRDRSGSRAGAGGRGGDPGRARRGRRGRCDGRGAREHEDGDGGAGSPFAGRVREVLAAVNSQVDAGRADAAPRPPGRRERPTPTHPSSASTCARPRTPRTAGARASAARSPSGASSPGTTSSARRARTLVADYGRLRDELESDDAELRRAELALLTTFADLCELSRNRPTEEEEDADERVHSPREHFHTYLHSLDIEQEHLPDAFRAKLSRALPALRRRRSGPGSRARGGGLPDVPRPGAGCRPDPGGHGPAGALAATGRPVGRSGP